MRIPSRVLATFLTLASLQLLASSDALAIVLRHEPLADSAARATDIVSGHVVAAAPRWGNDRRDWIVTDYTVVVDDVVRAGNVRAGQTITVSLWGGTIGDETWSIKGLTHPRVGESFLWLLKADANSRQLAPIGHAAGLMKIVAREDGTRTVREHDGAPLAAGRSAEAFALQPAGRSAEAFARQTEVSLADMQAALAVTAFDPAKADQELQPSAPDALSARPVAARPYTWFGLWPGRVPISPFGSWARSWQGLDRVEIDKWGYYADVWDIRAATDTYSPRDGTVDLIGFPSSASLQPVFGYSWEPGVVGITFTYLRGLTIVDATVALNPGYPWTSNDAAVFRGDSTAVSFGFTMLHELGHVLGLDHTFDRLSVMNYPPLGFDAVPLVYRDDARGVRALFPTRSYGRTDLGVHLYYHGPNAGQFIDASFPSSISAGASFTLANWTVENSGTTTISPVVELWLQSSLESSSPTIFLRTLQLAPPLASGFGYTPGSMADTVTVPASTPPGQYHLLAFVRGDGGAAIGRFPFSNNWGFSRRRITVTGGGALSPPTALTATVSGTNVTFTWQPPATGAPAGYVLEAGSGPGLANLATLPIAGTLTSFATAAPPGTFYVRLRASNGVMTSAPSNEVVFTTGTPGPAGVPGPPSSIQATLAGTSLTISWTPPATGVVTGYVLEAGTAPGLANVANTPVGLVTAYWAPNVPSGTYYIRVRAANSFGVGAPSTEVRVTVP